MSFGGRARMFRDGQEIAPTQMFRVEHHSEPIVSCDWSQDPAWAGECSNGHPVTWKTLVRVVDESHWCSGDCGAGEPHQVDDRVHHECPECRVPVEGALIPPFTPIRLEPNPAYFIDDVEVSEEEFLRERAQAMSAEMRRSGRCGAIGPANQEVCILEPHGDEPHGWDHPG